MRTIGFIIQKEFKQIFRNRAMLPIIFVVPMIQLIILVNAATYEIRDIRLLVIDKDITPYSRNLISKLDGSPYFKIQDVSTVSRLGEKALNEGRVDVVLEIPKDFQRKVINRQNQRILLNVNAIDGVKAGLSSGYLQSIISSFAQIPARQVQLTAMTPRPRIDVEFSHWFNTSLDYKTFMVPGILVLLVTMIGTFLSGMNIVREKEIGTIEQLNVTPIRKHEFIIGKLAPFLILGLFELALGLALAWLIYRTPIVGSLPLVFGFATLYLLVVLGIGLLISTVTDTQQQAMFVSWFFMVIFILMSGLFTPIENMPPWAQKITLFNPVRYFIEIMRMVLLKGSGFADVKQHFLITAVYAFIILGLATWRYRKTV